MSLLCSSVINHPLWDFPWFQLAHQSFVTFSKSSFTEQLFWSLSHSGSKRGATKIRKATINNNQKKKDHILTSFCIFLFSGVSWCCIHSVWRSHRWEKLNIYLENSLVLIVVWRWKKNIQIASLLFVLLQGSTETARWSSVTSTGATWLSGKKKTRSASNVPALTFGTWMCAMKAWDRKPQEPQECFIWMWSGAKHLPAPSRWMLLCKQSAGGSRVLCI